MKLNMLRQLELGNSRGRTRTCDPLINSQLLYQLSYRGVSVCNAKVGLS